MRLVLSGDLHLGRSSSRIPDTVRPEEVRSVTSWMRIVDFAIEKKADIVCLSGDIADQSNKFWESIGPLERGIQRLAENGIRTVAVAGNHDFDVLPRLADQLPSEHFTLLGRNGKWERITIKCNGEEALHIDGWSFPSGEVAASPLNTYKLDRDPQIPILGMVHGDLDAATSPYAPLQLIQLQSLAPSGWLLGHIHAPRFIEGSPWVLYPGSPQALDPGETGPHGPWIVDIENGRMGLPVQFPMSSVWYERCTIDLSDVSDETGLEAAILDRIRAEADGITCMAGPFLLYTSLRVKLTGHTAASHCVNKIAGYLEKDFELTSDRGSTMIEKVENQTIPAIDLVEYAKSSSAAGAVAGLLLELEKDEVSEPVEKLIRKTIEKLRSAEKPGSYGLLKMRETDNELAREYLRTNSRALLTELAGQIDG